MSTIGVLRWIPVLAVGLSACAHQSRSEPALDAVSGCRVLFQQLDEVVDELGVGDGGAYRMPGFSFLRSDRLLASMADEIDQPWRLKVWLQRLGALDQQAREVELRHVASRGRLATQPQVMAVKLQRCRAALIEQLMINAEDRSGLFEAVGVPDEYSVWARVFGLYPLAAPVMSASIKDFQKKFELAQQQINPATLEERWTQWWPPQSSSLSPREIAAWIETGLLDPLGIPSLDAGQWNQLAAVHAPVFVIESQSDADRLAAPQLAADGVGADTARPELYFQTAYTRFGRRILPQLVYSLWFSSRPAQTLVDPHAGILDGVIWRVTLGVDGRPLAYDTIHACGSYHRLYPTRRLPLRRPGVISDPVAVPQALAPTDSVAVILDAGRHQVLGVIDRSELPETRRPKAYLLQSYRRLLTLSSPQGQSQSLFAPDGLVPGTERGKRWYLWPSGIRSPGAMRQWGRHATSQVGRRHFDDPNLLCQVFDCGG